jgi:ABC-type transport system involved in multi-copper enzyme maturation permease subunit
MAAMLGLFLITLVMPLMGAGALSRERENGTWEMLRLSLLEPRQIIFGKLMAPLIALASVFAISAPILLPCVRWFQFGEPHNSSDFGPSMNYAFFELLLLAATSFFCVSWGLWLSWRCRNTVNAMAFALISLLFAFVGMPWIYSLWLGNSSQSWVNHTAVWHPFFAMIQLFNPWQTEYGSNSPKQVLAYGPWQALQSITVVAGTGVLILFDLNRRMKHAWQHAVQESDIP